MIKFFSKENTDKYILKKSRTKPLIAMDLSTKGKGGGPFTSTTRIMNSSLRENYDFAVINYDVELYRGISLKRILDLKKQLEDLSPDIVHFTGLQLSGFHMIVACKLAGVKNTIVTVRGFSGESIEFNPIKRFLLTYIFEPLTLLLTKSVYGVSEYVVSRNMIKLFSYKSIGAIYNFPPTKKEITNTGSIRDDLGFDTSDIIVASVGRVNTEKGYHILEEAIKKFTAVDNLKFVVVGHGDYLETMRSNLSTQMKNGQVKLLGYRDDIQYILKESDIFVLPTLHETLSVALLEASAESLPLIASNVGGVPEIVENGFNGILVEANDINGIVKAIEKLYMDYDLRIQFGKNAFNKLNSKFSKESIESKISELYNSILKK